MQTDNYYVVLDMEDDDMPPINFDDRDQAAEYCHHEKIPHFYEVNPINPMEPVNVWELEWNEQNQGYTLQSKSWSDMEKEHDQHLT